MTDSIDSTCVQTNLEGGQSGIILPVLSHVWLHIGHGCVIVCVEWHTRLSHCRFEVVTGWLSDGVPYVYRSRFILRELARPQMKLILLRRTVWTIEWDPCIAPVLARLAISRFGCVKSTRLTRQSMRTTTQIALQVHQISRIKGDILTINEPKLIRATVTVLEFQWVQLVSERRGALTDVHAVLARIVPSPVPFHHYVVYN